MKKILLMFVPLFMFFVFYGVLYSVAYADLTDGLVAYYPFNGNASDQSGNGNDGDEYGGIQYKQGIIGDSASFDGVDDYIRVPSNSSLNPVDQLSISFWVKVDGITNVWSPIVHKGGPQLGGLANREYSVWLQNTSNFFLASAGDGSSQNYNYSCCAQLGFWTHFVGIIDRQNNRMKIYVDGDLKIDVNDDPYSTFNNNDNDLILGWTEEIYSAFSPFKGRLDEIRIYNRVLTEDEINALSDENSTIQPVTIIEESTFDTGLDGWSGHPSEVSWRSSGGNPGGYALWLDSIAASPPFTAPGKFLGDWSALDGEGFISFDQAIATGSYSGSPGGRYVAIAGPGGSATWFGPRAPSNCSIEPVCGWTNFKVPLIESAWVINSGTWSEILAEITHFAISSEHYTSRYGDQEATALDNVRLVATIAPNQFGECLQASPNYEFSLKQDTQKNVSVQLFNNSDQQHSATLEIINPRSDDLAITLTQQNQITLAQGETVDIPVVIDASETPVGVYDGILLKVTVENCETLYSNLKVTVVEQDLPDLTLRADDIKLTDYTLGESAKVESTTLKAVIHNNGLLPASNVPVQFYSFGKLLGETVIDDVPSKGIGVTTITTDQITTSGEHLIRVVIDYSDAELSETNNEASKIIKIGSGVPTEGYILVTGSLPSQVYTDSLFNITGHAVYDLYINGNRNTDYVVKGGPVQITIKGDGGTQWVYGGVHTDANGNFSKYLQAPLSPGAYRILMTVTDTTFIGSRELDFEVIERPASPPLPPLPPGGTGTDPGGDWNCDPPEICIWEPSDINQPLPASDVRVFSENIHFTVTDPSPGEEITVFAKILYWAPRTTDVANIPVNFYVTYPGTTPVEIGQAVIQNMSVGVPDYGSRYVYTTWKNQKEGIYLVEVEIDPSYVEENMLNNAATKAIIVGELEGPPGGVISGHVTDYRGGVKNVEIELYDSNGTTLLENRLTDDTGHYLFEHVLPYENVPVDTYQVRINTPDGYLADAETKSADVTDQSITEINFQLTKQGPPISDAGPDQTVNEGDTVTLDGSGSSDPDNDSLTYSWEQIGGPSVYLDLNVPVHPTFVAPSVQVGGATITFKLIVNDGELSSESDTVDITVKNVNNPPIADAGDVQTVKEESQVTLDGSGSWDLDGEALTYSWSQIAGSPVSLTDSTAEKPSFTAPLVSSTGETLTFELTVNDGIDDSETDTVDILVENVNHSPTANAGPNQTVDEGSLVKLDGSESSDPDNDTLTYQWEHIDGPPPVDLNLSNPVHPTFNAPEVEPGGDTITIQLIVKDDGDLSSNPDQVEITVLDINDPPACDLAYPSLDSLWPPNHKFVLEEIVGVTDLNNENVEITVTSVTQDEPVNGLGDGDTSPDAISQDGNVLLRAERSGNGNGRVYTVNFTADDGAGGTCEGSVTVCVPHDRRDTGCIDDGQTYDSLQP